MTGVLQVQGLREVQRTLRRLEEDTTDLKDAHASAASTVANAAAARAPKRTGRLANSVRGNRAAGKAEVKAGGAAVPYAGPVHWGWPAHHMTGDPFIADAAVDTESQWLPAYEHALADVVDRIT